MAGLTVQSFRDYVRAFIDVGPTDIQDSLIDFWTQEGYDDLIGLDVRWPFFEVGGQDNGTTYSLTTVAAQQVYPLTNVEVAGHTAKASMDPKRIIAVQGPHWELPYASQTDLESVFTPSVNVSSEPERWSIWGETGITLWPVPNAAFTVNIRGYRNPVDWMSEGAGSMVDAPTDFHTALQQYVLSNAWSQQSDPQQAAYWMQNYLAAQMRLRKKYIRAPMAQNLVLNSGKITRDPPAHLRFPFEGLNSP